VAHEWQQQHIAVQSLREMRRQDGVAVNAVVLSPTVRVRVSRPSSPDYTVIQPCWPGYLLVQLPETDWHLMQRKRGVARVLSAVGDQHRPAWVSDAWVDAVSKCIREGVMEDRSIPAAPLRLPAIDRGTEVLVSSGPFAGWRGVVQLSSAERVSLLLRAVFDGARAMPISAVVLPRSHVEVAA
jgi:transcription antitermination factor NusG